MNERVPGGFEDADFVGVTGIRYDTADVRYELSLATAEAWREADCPYVVVDGSPQRDEHDTWVADAHTARGATVLRAEVPGIASQRMQGVAHAVAAGAERTDSHEPEKVPMPGFAAEIGAALRVDMIHPAGMVYEETGDPLFDAKRYEQFRLQLDYLLRRDDVAASAVAAHLQHTILGSIAGMKDASNEAWADRFDQMEAAAMTVGYEPAERLRH